MRFSIKNNDHSIAVCTAEYIVTKINTFKPTASKPFVMALPTDISTITLYNELIRLHMISEVSFKHVVFFIMNEYVNIAEDHPQSCYFFMYNSFFKHIDIPQENINILNGNASDLLKECTRFEQRINTFGGIHLLIGNIGTKGEIAFNEQGSSFASRTRIKRLSDNVLSELSKDFDNNIANVPQQGLTIGIETIMNTKEVVIMALGHNKATAIHHIFERNINHQWPLSALQLHKNSTFIGNKEATSKLSNECLVKLKRLKCKTDIHKLIFNAS